MIPEEKVEIIAGQSITFIEVESFIQEHNKVEIMVEVMVNYRIGDVKENPIDGLMVSRNDVLITSIYRNTHYNEEVIHYREQDIVVFPEGAVFIIKKDTTFEFLTDSTIYETATKEKTVEDDEVLDIEDQRNAIDKTEFFAEDDKFSF